MSKHRESIARTILNRIGNPFVGVILKTPFHRLLSRSVLLLTVTGQRSGKRYTFPVQYVQRGEALYIGAPASHSWPRNLEGEGGAPVAVLLRGERFGGTALIVRGEAMEQAEAAIAGTSLAALAASNRDGRLIKIFGLHREGVS